MVCQKKSEFLPEQDGISHAGTAHDAVQLQGNDLEESEIMELSHPDDTHIYRGHWSLAKADERDRLKYGNKIL